ncbi:hypothetical protein F2Q69_00018253 [Brassica cretica]|uniref:Uncharacterized protein n=1 Tax=Brassica cretica TaxID=69181 RepID=A0A8S9PZD9_BRACR|nr:hypothetical protein F2Q69_00018253 [Brassica cretica]
MIASPVLVWIQMNVAMLVGVWPWLPSCSSREATSIGFRSQEEVPSQECFKSLFASFQKIQRCYEESLLGLGAEDGGIRDLSKHIAGDDYWWKTRVDS